MERLLYRWAKTPGPTGDALRAQIEAAAALVAEHQRARVLGPLHSDIEDQAAGAASTLLLALALHEFGWVVEHEPVIDEETPDLRIAKRSAQFVVEVRQVIGWTRDQTRTAYTRVGEALDGLRTRTPLHFMGTPHVAGGASLRGLRPFVKRALGTGPGEYEFRDEGVLLVFHVGDDVGDEIPAFTGYVGTPMHGDDYDAIRAAIDEKLKKYKLPLVIALEMVDCIWAFESVEEVLCGRQVMQIPINTSTGSPAGEMTLGRAPDGMVIRGDSDAQRARDRLDALLPFQVGIRSDGFRLGARVLANPFRPGALLREFTPIPRLLVTDSAPGKVTMRMFADSDSVPVTPKQVEAGPAGPARPQRRRLRRDRRKRQKGEDGRGGDAFLASSRTNEER